MKEDISDHLKKFYKKNKQAKKIVDKIKKYDFSSLSDEELKLTKDQFKERLNCMISDNSYEDVQKALRSLLPELYARAEEVMRRKKNRKEQWQVTGNEQVWDMVPYEVQHIGAVALNEGKVAEIATGEGKTLVAVMPLMLNALAGKSHLVTVNEYLAQRDCEWMRPIYEALGFSVGLNLSMDGMKRIFPDKDPRDAKREAYSKDILYTTASEIGFDYMRDHMVGSLEEKVMSSMDYAIVDEADHILIDEARTPLIISGPPIQSAQADRAYYELADKVVRSILDLQKEAEKEFKQKLESKTALLKGKIREIDNNLERKLKTKEEEMKAKIQDIKRQGQKSIDKVVSRFFAYFAFQQFAAKAKKKIYEHKLKEITAKETYDFERDPEDESETLEGRSYIRQHDMAQVYTFTERGISKLEEIFEKHGLPIRELWDKEGELSDNENEFLNRLM
ncbi:MAG: hypothetical protein DRP08_07390, partial [Candidatus Aenigmatarchaeota archaeon]